MICNYQKKSLFVLTITGKECDLIASIVVSISCWSLVVGMATINLHAISISIQTALEFFKQFLDTFRQSDIGFRCFEKP